MQSELSLLIEFVIDITYQLYSPLGAAFFRNHNGLGGYPVP